MKIKFLLNHLPVLIREEITKTINAPHSSLADLKLKIVVVQ